MGDKSKSKKEVKKVSVSDLTKKKDSGAGSHAPKVKEEKGKAGMGTVIRSCTCQSDWQDRTYGKGMRVHNVGGTTTGPRYRCTVCGK